MRSVMMLLLTLMSLSVAGAESSLASLLSVLDNTLDSSAVYVRQKESRIAGLHQKLANCKGGVKVSFQFII